MHIEVQYMTRSDLDCYCFSTVPRPVADGSVFVNVRIASSRDFEYVLLALPVHLCSSTANSSSSS